MGSTDSLNVTPETRLHTPTRQCSQLPPPAITPFFPPELRQDPAGGPLFRRPPSTGAHNNLCYCEFRVLTIFATHLKPLLYASLWHLLDVF